MKWTQVGRNNPHARAIADRHYSRQKPGTPGFTPPGRVLVLLALQGDATWATSWPYAEYVHRVYPDAWLCSLFRNESQHRASLLIEQAVAATRWRYGTPPPSGMITLIDPTKVQTIKQHGVAIWGWTYRKVGFEEVGKTQGGLIILQLRPDVMPEAQPPIGAQGHLWD